jgi:hypothetical protein
LLGFTVNIALSGFQPAAMALSHCIVTGLPSFASSRTYSRSATTFSHPMGEGHFPLASGAAFGNRWLSSEKLFNPQSERACHGIA